MKRFACSAIAALAVIACAALAACGSGGGIPDAPPHDTVVPPGAFSVSWTFTDTAGNLITCEKVGATSVKVVAQNDLTGDISTVSFPCGNGTGTAQDLPPGTYDMAFTLLGAIGPIVMAPPQDNVMIASQQTTGLSTVVFVVDTTGKLVVSLDAGTAGGNCATTGNGGAGITSTTITLVHTASGLCEPVTFGYLGGTYTVDCTTPVVGPCFDSTETLTAISVPTDGYTIHVRGFVGSAACYTNDDALQVPPEGATLTRTLSLAFATGTTGC